MGLTALMIASIKGHYPITVALIKAGANVNLETQQHHNYTALMMSCTKGHHLCTLTLIEAGATVDTQNSMGLTALMIYSPVWENKATASVLRQRRDEQDSHGYHWNGIEPKDERP